MSDSAFTTPEAAEKKDKISTPVLYNMISDWVNHKHEYLPEVFKNTEFPKSYRAVKQDMAEDMPALLEMFKDSRGKPLVRFSSLKSITMETTKQLRKISVKDPEYYQLNMTSQQVEKALYHWAIISTTNGDLPLAMVSHDDIRPAFYRLQYEPMETVVDPEWHCPTWNEIGSRTTNWKAFCMRIASIFDDQADRKQAIYMSGPKDCGKSQIEAMIAHLAGGDSPSGGGFCSLSPDQTPGAHWLEPLVGKRVVCISEAAGDFLESSRFKSLTGDLWHMVNPKGRAIVNRPLPVLLFLFGNEPPEISGKPELLERVIDCRIDPPKLNGEGLIPDHEYQELLKSELQAFLGYCFSLYEPYRRRRLPCERDTLEESTMDHEQDAIDYFNTYFVEEDGHHVLGEMLYRRFRFDYINRHDDQKRIREIWERRFKITKKRTKKGVRYDGMRFKTTAEIANDKLESNTEVAEYSFQK